MGDLTSPLHPASRPMKNSIGSLAALAAFTIPAAMEAAPAAASFSNLALPYDTAGSVDVDMDGDGTNDFYIFSNSVFVRLEAYDNTMFTDTPRSFGSLVSTGDPNTSSLELEEVGVPSIGASYFGISFTRSGQTHTGWLLLDFTGDPKLAVSGAWETVVGESISVGSAVPEPSAAAALAGAAALVVATRTRSRRRSALPASS